MKKTAPERTGESTPKQESIVPAIKILLVLSTIASIGLYSWHQSQPDVPVDGSEIAPQQQLPSAAPTVEAPSGKMPPTPGRPAESQALSDADWRSISSQIAEADRAFVSSPSAPGIHKAFNRPRNLAFTVSSEAVEIRPRTGSPDSDGSDWFVRLVHPQSGGTAVPTSPAADRVELARDGMLEWYVHREEGLEQGFTLKRLPAGQPLDRVAIDLPIESSLIPQLADGGVQFVDSSGEPVLSYEKLQVFDAEGQSLPAEMQLVSAEDAPSIRLVLDTSLAVYPVVIDPLLTTPQPLTIPEDTVSAPDMGTAGSIALDGDTLVVGEPSYEPYLYAGPQGAVSIFYRQADGSWLFHKRVETATGGYFFGEEVDLDGDTLIARDNDSARVGGGDFAFIFERNQGGADNWGQVVQLDPSPSTYFVGQCGAVAVDGDLAFVGYPEVKEPSHWATRVVIFYRHGGGSNNWGRVQTIESTYGGVNGDDSWFGLSLAVSPNGQFLIIGAPRASGGAVANIYRGVSGYFYHAGEIPAPDSIVKFADKVAISDTSFAINAPAGTTDPNTPDAVYVYDYSPSGTYNCSIGTPQKILPPVKTVLGDGHWIGLNSSYLCIGHARAETVGTDMKEPLFFYLRDAGTQQWTLSRTMFDPQTNSASAFGDYFDLTENRLAVAAPANKEVQVYALDGHAGDQLGSSVCIDADTVVVGAAQADGLVANSGAAYVFGRQTGTLEPWNLERKIMANDGATDDLFGYSASLSGDIVVVGAPGDDDHGSRSGAAYAFGRNAGGTANWGQFQKFAPADTLAGDYFGNSVGIWSSRVVIGAPYHDAFGLNEGTAYLYESGLLKTNFDGFIAGPGDQFGFSVDIDGDFVVAGAPANDFNAGVANAGCAIVFSRDPATGNWSEFSTLFHGSPGTDDQFGWSVSIEGSHAVVGAPFRDEGGLQDSGAAYLYSLTPFLPPVDKKFVPYDPGTGRRFGSAVALKGSRLAVGASGSGLPASGDPGTAYVFDQNHEGTGNWGQAMKRVPSDGAAGDLFGYAVAVDGDTVVVGAPWHDGPQQDSGAAYFYGYEPNYSPTDIALAPDSVYENRPVGTVVGELSASDPDVLDTHTFGLVPGTGSADNAAFSVDGSKLRTAAIFDYEVSSNRQIRVRATDPDGAFFEKALTVHILDVPASEEDSDVDGMPDWWEMDHFGNPTNAPATGNPDLDPHDNLAEYIAGSDPNSSNSYLRITNAAPVVTGFMIEWAPSISNRWYGVNWTNELTNGFMPLATGIDFPQNSYTDAVHGAGDAGFYQIDVKIK